MAIATKIVATRRLQDNFDLSVSAASTPVCVLFEIEARRANFVFGFPSTLVSYSKHAFASFVAI